MRAVDAVEGSRTDRDRYAVRQTLAVVAILGAVAVHLGSGSVRATANQDANLVSVARIALPRDWNVADGRVLAVDPSGRRIIVTQADTARLLSYDLDTYQLVQTVKPSAGTSGGFQAVDLARHRLFIYSDSAIQVYNMLNIAAPPRSLPTPSNFDGEGGSGFYFSSRDDLLYVVSGQPLTVAAVDPDSGAELWSVALSKCGGPLNEWQQEVLGESEDSRYLYTECELQSAAALTSSPGPGAAVRVTLPANPRIAQGSYPVDVYPGITPGSVGAAEALWVPGVDRLVTLVPTNGNTGWAAYVFDGPTTTFVASPPLFQPSGSSVTYVDVITPGLDPTTGRVYAHDYAFATQGRDSQGGPCTQLVPHANSFALLEADALGNAVQTRPSGDPGLSGADRGTGFDPVKRNLWMVDEVLRPTQCNANQPAGSDNRDGRSFYLAVYHDGLPPAERDATSDPDLATANIPEAPNAAGANFTAQAAAFGARYQVAPSGVEGPLTNASAPSAGSLSCDPATAYSAGFGNVPLGVPAPAPPPLPAQYHDFCHAGNREATFASVPRVALDTSEVRAVAIAGETDRESAENLESATNAAQPGSYSDDVVGYVNSGGPEHNPPPTQAPRACSALAATPSPGPSMSPTPGPFQPGCFPTAAADLAPYVGGEALPFAPASCADNGSGPGSEGPAYNQVQVGQGPPLASTGPSEALTQCSFEALSAHASAFTNAPTVGYPVAAHEATSSAEVGKSGGPGTSAASEAVVEGIDVAGLLHIGRLTMQATTSAHGRPGTSHASLTCTLSDVTVTLPGSGAPSATPGPTGLIVPLSPSMPSVSTIPGTSMDQRTTFTFSGDTSCWDGTLQADIAQLNQQLEGILSIEFPPAPTTSAEAGHYEGDLQVVQEQSPGGYIAQVEASKLRQLQNTVLLNDPSIEQPGMIVTLYQDSPTERDRVIATFGGVAATATYGIFPLGMACNTSECAPPPPPVTGPPALRSTLAGGPHDGGGGGGAMPLRPRNTGVLGTLLDIVNTVVDGLQFLWEHPGLIPPLLAVWALLLWPVYVMARRRPLLQVVEGGV